MARGKYLITANCISNCVQSQGAAVFMITLRIGLRRVKEANSTRRCRRGVCVTRRDVSVDVPGCDVEGSLFGHNGLSRQGVDFPDNRWKYKM